MKKQNIFKITAILLVLAMLFSMTLFVGVSANELMPLDTTEMNPKRAENLLNEILTKEYTDDKIRFEVTMEDDFTDDVVLVILTKEASKDDSNFTFSDMKGINIAEVTDIVRLSDEEFKFTNQA